MTMAEDIAPKSKKSNRNMSWKSNSTQFNMILKTWIKKREWQLLLLIILIGFSLRFLWFLRTLYLGLPLDQDGQEYMDIGENLLKGFYPWPREPFFPLIVAFTFFLFSPSALVLRLLTVFLSIVVIYLSYSLARVCFKGSWECLLPPFLVATNFYLIFNSVRGLREELYSILILLILILTIKCVNSEPRLYDYMSFGLLSAMICLTRLEGFIIIILLIIFFIWHGKITAKKINYRPIIAILTSSALAIIGWIILSQILFKNPFPMSEIYGSWLYQYEFVRLRFQEWPPKFYWVRMSFFDYLFEHHSLPRLIQMMFFGFVNSLTMISNFIAPVNPLLIPFGLALLLLGLLFSLKDEMFIALHFTLIGGLFPYLLLFYLEVDFRFIYPFLPLIFLFIGYVVLYLKENAPSRVYAFRIFSNKRISITIYTLSFLSVVLIILSQIMKFISIFVMWDLILASVYMMTRAIFASYIFIITLIALYLYYRWKE
jgi:hypothetical protein